jgi:hypothetical protein
MSPNKPANRIAAGLREIKLPPLTRPAVGPSDAPTEELVFWAIRTYAYSTIAHVRTILDGLLALAVAGNEQTMVLVYRHIYEWTMHGYYMLEKLQCLLEKADLVGAWQLTLQIDTGNAWIKNHGAKYAPAWQLEDIPNSIRVSHFVAAYERR